MQTARSIPASHKSRIPKLEPDQTAHRFSLDLVPYLRSDVNTEVIYKIICILDNLSIEYFPKWNRADDGAMNSNVSNIVSGNYSKNHKSSRQEKSRPFVF
jgi:hypothetical protein